MKKELINKKIWNTKCKICGKYFTAHGILTHKAVAHNKTTENNKKTKQKNIKKILKRLNEMSLNEISYLKNILGA